MAGFVKERLNQAKIRGAHHAEDLSLGARRLVTGGSLVAFGAEEGVDHLREAGDALRHLNIPDTAHTLILPLVDTPTRALIALSLIGLFTVAEVSRRHFKRVGNKPSGK